MRTKHWIKFLYRKQIIERDRNYMSSKKILLDRFSLKDLDKVIEINLVCLPENYIPSFFLDIYKNCPDAFLVAKVDGEVVGYIMCRLESGFSDLKRFRLTKKGHVVSVAVKNEYRKKGIGTTLLEEAIIALKKYSVTECFMEVRTSNHEAINLYRKMGFELVRKTQGYYQDGADALLMRLNFSGSKTGI